MNRISSAVRHLCLFKPTVYRRSISSAPPVTRLGVIGAGQMVGPFCLAEKTIELIQGDQGLGIALVAAQKAEVLVTIVDTSQETLDKGRNLTGPCCDSVSSPFHMQ